MGVSSQHPEYVELAPDWQICRDVISGERAMHERGEAYLPKLVDETGAGYDARRKRSNFFNGSWRTLSGMVGLVFRKPARMEVPAAIVPYLKDVTMSGRSLETFVKNGVYEVLTTGRVGILVDHPNTGNVTGITVAVAERQGLRPTMQIYEAESIINWRYRMIRNAWTLAMVVLKECRGEPVDEFEEKEVDRYRVLDLDATAGDTYRVRIFEKDDHGRDVMVSADIR